MRKLTLLPPISKLRLALLGLAVVLTILASLPVQAQSTFTQSSSGCLPYCNNWAPTGDCCYTTSRVYGKESRQCTDGYGTFCTEIRCTGFCAV